VKSLYIVSAILFLFSLSLGFSEKLRTTTKNFFLPSTAEVLSVIKTVQIKPGVVVDIYKIKENNQIVVKFYHSKNGEHFQTFSLQDAWDGYYQVNGKNTNLFLNDVDQDQTLEVLAPTFDQNLTAKLHILKFDSESQNFLPFPF
jgi:hypothetical protein